MNKIVTSLKLAWTFAKGIFSRLKNEYDLTFVRDEGIWYIDMPWPGERYNLSMVAGSARMLSFLDTNADDKVRLLVRPSRKPASNPGFFECTKSRSTAIGGSFYDVSGLEGFNGDIWICPVTLCVLGCYPKYLYVKCIG